MTAISWWWPSREGWLGNTELCSLSLSKRILCPSTSSGHKAVRSGRRIAAFHRNTVAQSPTSASPSRST
jgi:hypothetical protein